MSNEVQMSEYEKNSIFTHFAFSADKVEVRRLLGSRKYKYMGRIPRDEVEREPGVVAERFGGGVYRLQVIHAGNKYGRSIEMAFDAVAYGPPLEDTPTI